MSSSTQPLFTSIFALYGEISEFTSLPHLTQNLISYGFKHAIIKILKRWLVKIWLYSLCPIILASFIHQPKFIYIFLVYKLLLSIYLFHLLFGTTYHSLLICILFLFYKLKYSQIGFSFICLNVMIININFL